MMHTSIGKVKGMSKRSQESARRKIKMQSFCYKESTATEIARLVGRTPERVGQILGPKKPRAKRDVADTAYSRPPGRL